MYKLLVLFITLIVVVLISIQFGVMTGGTHTPITEGATGLAQSDIKCGSNKFCVGMYNSRPYCYGNNGGCLWGRNDCQTDNDCKKYSVNSPKYTDNRECSGFKAGDWPYDACIITSATGNVKGYLYGPWIEGRTENNALEATMATLDNGKRVFMIEDANYTKMVSETNEEKYYRGKMVDFNKNNWGSYSDITGSKYYRLKMVETPVSVDEKNKTFNNNAVSLLRRVEKASNFKFTVINRDDFKNALAIVQFYKNYFDINLYPLIDRYTAQTTDDELNNTSEYRKLISLLTSLKENDINAHNELIQTMTNIRTTSSQQGFTGMKEGLNSQGDLTDIEATCYINNNANVLREVAGSIAGVTATPTPGLKFRVFNSYFGLNNPDAHQSQSNVNLGPWGTTGQEYTYYVNKMSSLKKENKCSFNENAVDPNNNVGYNWQWIANRKFLAPCILKEGLASSVAHIELGTKNIADKDAPNYILNNNRSEYYTVEWTGYFNPDANGNWQFYTASDDGSHLFIYDETAKMTLGSPDESEKVGGVPGLHGMAGTVRNKVLNSSKSYKLLFLFGENWGGDQVNLYYRCDNSPRANNWQHAAVVGNHIFYSLAPGGTTTYVKQNQYDAMTLEKAREHWIKSGKPDTYQCSPNQNITLTSADYINAYTSSPELQQRISQTAGSVSINFCDPTDANAERIYGGNCSMNPTAANVFSVQTRNYVNAMGIHNMYGQALPPKENMSSVEGFVEGLDINEYRLNEYFDALQKFGNVDKNNIPEILKNLKNDYGVDITSPDNVSNFMGPYVSFGVDTLEKLSDFRNQMTQKYKNFLSGTTQDIEFIREMGGLGYKYNTREYTTFMNNITDYGIKQFNDFIQFKKIMNDKLKMNGSPLEMIGLLKWYKVVRYSDVAGVANTLNSYIYGRGQNQNQTGNTFIKIMVDFGVTSKNYAQFMTDNGQIDSTDLIQHINVYSMFGVLYINDNSTATYLELNNELSKFALPADLTKIPNYIVQNTTQLGYTLDQISNTDAKKKAMKIIMYNTIGINSFNRYKDLMNDKANNTKHDLSRLVKEKTLHDFFNVSGIDNNMNSETALSKLSERFLKSIQVIQSMRFKKVCSLIDLFISLRRQLNMKYTDLRPYLESNTSLFQAKFSNFLKCDEGFTSSAPNSPTIQEGLEAANLINTVNTFGIYDKDQAYKVSNNKWKDIVSMNHQFKRFNVNNPDEYKVFMEELQKFGVDTNNMKEYVDMIYDFGVRYSDIKEFTIYISKVGVTWSTFKDFITTLMNFGVRMKHLISFMCYVYSFGIIYEPSYSSVFYQFLRSMQQYQLDYNGMSTNGKPKFINAMEMFVFLLERGGKKIDCSNPMKIVNEPPVVKYVDMYFEEGNSELDGRMIPYPLETIMMAIKSVDTNLTDFKDATAFDNLNNDTQIPFTSYAKVVNTRLELNETHQDGQLSYRTMYSFLKKIVGSYGTNKQSDMLKRLFMTGFMDDTIVDKEFQVYLTQRTISLAKLRELTVRIEAWNKGNNGKSPETINAYNDVVDMLNIMKIFPNFCIKLMEQYVRGPDFNIPKNDVNMALNPKNIRCAPYMKVGYREEDCPNQTTLTPFTTLRSSETTSISPTSVGSPVQITQHQQYGNYSSANPMGGLLTTNNSFYSTYDGRNQYSTI